MSLNKALWQQTLKHYRDWNESKFLEHVRSKKKKPAEKWTEFLELYSFGRILKPEPSQWEQIRKAQELETYYQNIRRFEDWRKTHGRKI